MRVKFTCPSCMSHILYLDTVCEAHIECDNLQILSGDSEPYYSLGRKTITQVTRTGYSCGECHNKFETFDEVRPYLTNLEETK